MLGLNRRITIIETARAVSDSGAIADDAEVILQEDVSAAIQAHVLNNLPPPADRSTGAGIHYLREFRCWFTKASTPNLTPHTTWIIKDQSTDEKFRVRAVIDDAGRSHHWLLRMENYDG